MTKSCQQACTPTSKQKSVSTTLGARVNCELRFCCKNSIKISGSLGLCLGLSKLSKNGWNLASTSYFGNSVLSISCVTLAHLAIRDSARVVLVSPAPDLHSRLCKHIPGTLMMRGLCSYPVDRALPFTDRCSMRWWKASSSDHMFPRQRSRGPSSGWPSCICHLRQQPCPAESRTPLLGHSERLRSLGPRPTKGRGHD